jgi:hypothetical protein
MDATKKGFVMMTFTPEKARELNAETVTGSRDGELSSLSDSFSTWYQQCVDKSFQVGPINATIVSLWSDIHRLQLDHFTIDFVVADNQ